MLKMESQHFMQIIIFVIGVFLAYLIGFNLTEEWEFKPLISSIIIFVIITFFNILGLIYSTMVSFEKDRLDKHLKKLRG